MIFLDYDKDSSEAQLVREQTRPAAVCVTSNLWADSPLLGVCEVEGEEPYEEESHEDDVNSFQLRQEFEALVDEWRADRSPYDSPTDMAIRPAYQRIIGQGEKVVPLILMELEKQVDHWFWALRAITGENPVADEHIGNLELMSQDWLEWGNARGLS